MASSSDSASPSISQTTQKSLRCKFKSIVVVITWRSAPATTRWRSTPLRSSSRHIRKERSRRCSRGLQTSRRHPSMVANCPPSTWTSTFTRKFFQIFQSRYWKCPVVRSQRTSKRLKAKVEQSITDSMRVRKKAAAASQRALRMSQYSFSRTRSTITSISFSSSTTRSLPVLMVKLRHPRS